MRFAGTFIVASACLGSVVAWSAPVSAQQPTLGENFQLETLDHASLSSSIYGVWLTPVPLHRETTADVVGQYASRPAVANRRVDGRRVEVAVVDDRWSLDLGAGLGLWDALQFDARLSVVASQSGTGLSDPTLSTGSVNDFSMGDVRLSGKWLVLDRAHTGSIGVAAGATLWLPTGAQGGLVSDGVVGVEPRVAVDGHLGPVLVSANLAYHLRGERAVFDYLSDDVIRWGAASRLPLAYGVAADLGVFGQHSPFSAQAADDPGRARANTAGHPVETVAGLSWVHEGFRIMTGVGAGLAAGVGAPQLRVLLGLAYRPFGDGVPASLVRRGGGRTSAAIAHSDAERDSDADGLTDDVDRCPYEAEDLDGFEDSDGCLDGDDDHDGIADFDDACPREKGSPDKRGCPLVDTDKDGIDDGIDQCVAEAEDADGFQDEDGCPEADNDQDGIPDAKDACPDEAEVVNGNDDEDGCPDEGKSLVSVRKGRIEILERVFFDSGRATIKQRSFDMLEQVASVLKANPHITLLAIAGHTDAKGSDRKNYAISKRRALAVRAFLVSRGVSDTRLLARGYGESHPIASNKTRKGRATNRRVEFLIKKQVQRADKPGGAP